MKEEGWITKREAATLAEVDERTIERKARAGKIASKGRPGFPTVYRAADVELLRQVGSVGVRTGILESVPAGNGIGRGRAEHEPAAQLVNSQLQTDPIRQLAALVVQALTPNPIGPTGPTIAPTGPTLSAEERAAQYVTLAEASAIKHLSQAYLRRQCQNKSLTAIKDRGWKIRRKDLEAL